MSRIFISKAAKLKGVSQSTLRHWEIEGKLKPERTASGHRRYDLAELSYTIGYARVSSHDQKEDLGSSLNYSKKGIKRVVRLIKRSEKSYEHTNLLQRIANSDRGTKCSGQNTARNVFE